MSKRPKRRRKKSGFAASSHADAKLHHDYQVERRKRRKSSSYQLELELERENH